MRIWEVTNFSEVVGVWQPCSGVAAMAVRVFLMARRGTMFDENARGLVRPLTPERRLVSPIEIAAGDSSSQFPVAFSHEPSMPRFGTRMLSRASPLGQGGLQGGLARESKPSRRCVPCRGGSIRRRRYKPSTAVAVASASSD